MLWNKCLIENSWSKTILKYLRINPISRLILNTDWNLNDCICKTVSNPAKTLPNFEKNRSWNERFEPDSSYVDPLILLRRAYTFSDNESDTINNNSYDGETKSEHFEEMFRETSRPEIDFSIMFDDINTFDDCDELTNDKIEHENSENEISEDEEEQINKRNLDEKNENQKKNPPYKSVQIFYNQKIEEKQSFWKN